jgi:hypothetical protein
MFKPIPNPYIVGNPIKSSKMFYGRADDFQYIKTKLEDGGKSYIIVLCGERRSGKTSILFQILSGRLGKNFVPILVDMQTMAGLKNEIEFFEKFAQETSKSLNEKIEPRDLFNSTTESTYKAFSGFLDTLHNKYADKHIIFLIDEYEIIESKIDEGSLSENFIPFLAGVLESDKKISFIFTGSSQIDQRKGDIWHVLFGKSLFRNVSFLSHQDTERLILEPIEGKITYDQEAVNLIYTLTYGQPFYTQVVCQNIVDYVNQKQRTHIQLEDLEVVISEILENPLPQMIYFWNSLQDDKKLVLSLLAEIIEKPEQRIKPEQIIKESKRRKFGLNLTIKELSTTLETLFHSNYVSKTDNGFSFQLDIFRRWIKRDHAIWRVMKEVSNLGQASSVSKIVFEGDEDDNTSGKSKIIIQIVLTLIIVVFLFWWFIPANEAEKKENASLPERNTEKTSDVQPQKDNTESTDKSAEKEDLSAKEVSTPPRKKVERNSRESQPVTKKPVIQKPKTNPAPGADTRNEDQANDARDAMLQAKKEAANASKTDLYTRAESFESDGNKNLADNKYNLAKTKFDQAAVYYKNALSEYNNSRTSLESKALAQEQQLNNFKQKVGIQYSLMDDYKQAQTEETQATNLLSSGSFNKAIEMFRKAENSYNDAIKTYEQAKDGITQTINAYLDGIEHESITQMKKHYTNFSSGLQSDWQNLFDYADDIKVGRTFRNYAIGNDKAAAQVDVNLDFKQADKSKTLNQWKFNLEKKGSVWIISSINEGN